MRCLMFEEIGKLNPSTTADPTMPVWIRVEASGICGTDLKSVYIGHRGVFVVQSEIERPERRTFGTLCLGLS